MDAKESENGREIFQDLVKLLQDTNPSIMLKRKQEYLLIHESKENLKKKVSKEKMFKAGTV